MTLEHEVRAVLAERYAELVDRASQSADESKLLKAGAQLLEVLDTLPIRKAEGGGAGDGSAVGRTGLHAVMDSPPAVGDAAHF